MRVTTTFTGGAHLEFAGASDRGTVRTANQDAFHLEPAIGLAVIADGVGGSKAGEIASSIAVATITSSVRRHLLAVAGKSINSVRLDNGDLRMMIHSALIDAHADVLEAAECNYGQAGMATTAVVLFIHGCTAVLGWRGDSSCFRFDLGGKLSRLTRNHNLAAAVGRDDRSKSALTAVLGDDSDIFTPEVIDIDVFPGDVFILCSDGLTDGVSDPDIASIAAVHSATPESIVEQLVSAANQAGGSDNITIALVRAVHVPAPDLRHNAKNQKTEPGGIFFRMRRWRLPSAGLAVGLAAGVAIGWQSHPGRSREVQPEVVGAPLPEPANTSVRRDTALPIADINPKAAAPESSLANRQSARSDTSPSRMADARENLNPRHDLGARSGNSNTKND